MKAENFAKIIECLKPHAVTGLHFKLDGKNISIVAEQGTSKTTVVFPPQRNHVGYGVFFVSFDDLYNCKNALKELDADVVISRSVQPFVPEWPSLHIRISDWFEAHTGRVRLKGVPKLRKSGSTLGPATVKATAHSLRPLSQGKTYRHSSGKIIRVDLDEPAFGLVAVFKEVA